MVPAGKRPSSSELPDDEDGALDPPLSGMATVAAAEPVCASAAPQDAQKRLGSGIGVAQDGQRSMGSGFTLTCDYEKMRHCVQSVAGLDAGKGGRWGTSPPSEAEYSIPPIHSRIETWRGHSCLSPWAWAAHQNA